MTKILMIMLDTIEDVKKFVQEMNKLPYGAKVHSRGYIVNASSIMGLFSLDLSEPVKVEFANIKEYSKDNTIRIQHCYISDFNSSIDRTYVPN